jgi:hypothetical protein
MISTFDNSAFEVHIKSGIRKRADVATDLISVECVHTCQPYAVEVGTNAGWVDGKGAKTYFRLFVRDDETDTDKEIEFTMIGESERNILAGLLEAAVGILNGGIDLKMSPSERI